VADPASTTTHDAPVPTRGARQARLAAARLYLCCDGRRRQGDLPKFLDAVLAGGVDVIQLREKGLEAREELALLELFAAAAARHGALVAVNDRADLALLADADIVHVGQGDLRPHDARRIVGPHALLGQSTHARGEVDAAAADADVDYFCVGPTWPTPTKPGRPAPGLDLTSYAARAANGKPWFAIGGIDASNLDEVLAAGARRIVVVRALTESDDPRAAAEQLRRRLESAG
jgi:thiamine-phosphate pyrophosphorylase